MDIVNWKVKIPNKLKGTAKVTAKLGSAPDKIVIAVPNTAATGKFPGIVPPAVIQPR